MRSPTHCGGERQHWTWPRSGRPNSAWKAPAFPWRTIRGQECSAYWPAGTAAWHINADIAMAFERYRIVTGDHSLEDECGLEVLIETARLWMSLGHHDRHGVWHLDGVTGPDEYTAIVRDNVFTNLMAAHNLRTAAEACNRHPEAARRDGCHHRGDGRLARRGRRRATFPTTTNWASTSSVRASPPSRSGTSSRTTTYPLLLHEPYVRLYPAQVIKQADLVLAMQWQSHAFTPEQKARNVDYYERRMVRDSSLSACTQAVMCAEVGHLELAHDYAYEAALIDLRDLHQQHPRRLAHGLAGRSLDGAGRRLRRPAGRRGHPVAGSCTARRHFAAAVPAAVARFPADRRRQPLRRHLHGARRARWRADHPARRRRRQLSTDAPTTIAVRDRKPLLPPPPQPPGREPTAPPGPDQRNTAKP